MCVHLTTETKSSKAFNRNKRKYQSAQVFLAQGWAGLALQLIQALSAMGFTWPGKCCLLRVTPRKFFGSRGRDTIWVWGTGFQHQKRVQCYTAQRQIFGAGWQGLPWVHPDNLSLCSIQTEFALENRGKRAECLKSMINFGRITNGVGGPASSFRWGR